MQAHLCVCQCSRRSGRSSEPGCEAGAHPGDGQGRALQSARPHGSSERKGATPTMKIARPSRAHSSHALRKRARRSQLMTVIKVIR